LEVGEPPALANELAVDGPARRRRVSATIELDEATPHEVFEHVVDWECFAENRISLHLVDSPSADGPEDDAIV